MKLYEADFYAWTQQTADALRRRDFATVDIASLAEEVEDLGKRERAALESRLSILLAHLLKWDFQPSKRSHSWQATIQLQRARIQRLLRQSPSLHPYLQEIFADAYDEAILVAIKETGLARKSFPPQCAYTLEEALRSKTVTLQSDEV